jgi:hypothetical protein
MTQEEINSANPSAPETSGEEGTPETESVHSDDAPLNRAQRRAQARGKTNSGGSSNSANPAGGRAGAIGRPGGHAGQVRFPRTGHK